MFLSLNISTIVPKLNQFNISEVKGTLILSKMEFQFAWGLQLSEKASV